MIKRDVTGLIVQHNADYPDQADGGDSAARTGIMALCGSEYDAYRLCNFATVEGFLVRNPNQIKWSDPKLTSRDQLIQWAAGVSKLSHAKSRTVLWRYAYSWFINKDILTPDVRLYLYACIGITAPWWIKVFGYPTLLLSLFWSTKVMPKNETNQMICICSVMGDWWLEKLIAWHPDLTGNIRDYWCGYPWRNQPEIADAIFKYIEGRLKK